MKQSNSYLQIGVGLAICCEERYNDKKENQPRITADAFAEHILDGMRRRKN